LDGIRAYTMRFEGTLKSWNDERGFGFIDPRQGDDEIFVHIKAFSKRNGRPAVGQRVTFEVEVGPQGKKRAKNVEAAQVSMSAPSRREERPANWDNLSLLAIPVLIAVYVGASIFWKVSPLWVAAYFIASIVTFFAYAFDKTAAVRGNWRTQEGTLLGLGLLCGWPGALLAQKGLRHKSSKPSFRNAFWITVLLNLLAFIALNSPQLKQLIR
jgi:uncharacterized membrane protein YsdA (DUF1294 family)/cold shock CspA family protein